MTNRQAAVLASRIFCVWFIYSAAMNATMLPAWFHLLQRNSQVTSAFAPIGSAGISLDQTAFLNLLSALLRVGINVAAAICCYRSAPGFIRFLTGTESETAKDEEDAV